MDEQRVQGAVQPPRGRGEVAAWAAAWLGALALAAWMGRLSPGWLAASAAGIVAWALLARGVPRGWRLSAALAFLVAAGTGGAVQLRLHQVEHDWDRVRYSAEERAAEALREGLDRQLDRAEAAVAGAAALARGAGPADPALFAQLSRLRRESGVSALAVYGPDGTPLAWAGEHRGSVPDSVRIGSQPYSYSAGPLFGYLYLTQRFGEGRTAVAPVLLEAHVAVGGGRPFAERFADRHGVRPRFTTPDLAQGAEDEVWDWKLGQSSILSVVFATLTPERWRERVAERGRWAVGLAGLAGFLLLAGAWFRSRAGPPGVPVAAATAALLVLPLGEMAGTEGVFSPLLFVLPLPGDLTLGQLLVVLAGLSVWLLARGSPGRWMAAVPLALRIGGAAAALAAALWLVRASVADAVLADRSAGGLLLVLALTLLAALGLLALQGRGDGGSPPPPRGRAVLAAALLVSAGLALGTVLWWRPGRELPFWSAALWAVPFALVALAGPRPRPGRGALATWLTLGWIAGTMALPHLWVLHLDARLRGAERELTRLGTAADPYLDFLLRQFSEKVLRYAGEGREGVSLLYQAWVQAGLAREGYEARVTLWDGPVPAAELRLGETQIPPEMVPDVLAAARASEEPRVERFTSLPELHYLLSVPLSDGRTATVAVPPRRHLGRSTALARFLDPLGEEERAGAPASLALVPGTGPAGAAGGAGATGWVRTGEGWRSEADVAFPSGPMHAHLLVRTPSTALLAVRGTLVLVGLLAAMTVLWSVARTLCGEPLGLASRQWGWLPTFRGRLTLTLFAFFLVPMAAFGATTYQALSREVVRTASALAQRALAQAAAEVQAATLGELSPHVGAELLLYHDGVLVEGGSPEVIELGLYPTWLPPEVYLDFATGESELAREPERRLAGQSYLVEYRRLGPEDVLAAPTPLASGEIARRQRELASVVLLAGLAGGVLSFVLSLAVGRALSRPIEGLSQAAAAVGGGDLSVRLPGSRRDEFGGLYRSFNRMVRNLRQARVALVRETRRTEAIVAEAGTGVAALDPAGRVALINRRACEILGTEVEPGERLPRESALPAAVAGAVDAFLASRQEEGLEEREVDGRSIRLRMRRLPTRRGPGGTVLVIEDVTSEIRTARVLAWGEMARQVAHEIKNPLTPIKLSVQHLRRAHADGRPDFGAILHRNVDAVLHEIDRLGEIARAFARFGTPADASLPPEPVDAGRVVQETMALYRAGRDGIGYEVAVDPETPRGWARVGELKEVLVNLLENARAAVHDQGDVRISVGPAGGGAWVRVDVADTGEGIPPESVGRVFEPQFSTRSSGTGLGLAIVKRLVESWGGEVTLDSEPGVGTTVHVRLRAVEEGR